MMNIDILYESNQAGDILLNVIKDNFEQVNSEVNQIENMPFLIITIKKDDAKYTRVINPPQAQLNCMNKDTIYKILGRNKIACRKKSQELISRCYEILVFDMAVISVKQSITVPTTRAIRYIKEKQCEKAAELSKKTVYHLGLDFAMVTIALTASQQYLVVGVEPSPSIRPVDLPKVMAKLESMQKEYELISSREVKLGADPEFMLSKNQKMVPASVYFPHYGRVGCDNIRTRDRQQHPIGELRPTPSVSPLKLTENLKAALQNAVKLAPSHRLKWVAGSRPFKGYPIGGHIHFSNIKLNYAVLRSLDNFLAIPVLMLEDSSTAVLRRKKYGALADFRIKKYGGFEYRTLSSWLVSPDITRAVLCLAKIIVSQYPALNRNYLDNLPAQLAFYAGDKEYFKPIFKDLWFILGQTAMYGQYKDEIQIIQDMIENDRSWNEKEDLRKAWNFSESPAKKPKADHVNKKNKYRRYRPIARSANNTVTSRQRPNVISRSNRNTSHNPARVGSPESSRTGASTSSNADASRRHRFKHQTDRYRVALTTNLG